MVEETVHPMVPLYNIALVIAYRLVLVYFVVFAALLLLE
jgi:hypothetical protein